MIRNGASGIAGGLVLMLLLSLAIPLVAPAVSAEQKEYISTLDSLPGNRAGFGLLEDDGKLYAFGGTVNAIMSGTDALDSVLIYDIATGVITNGSRMVYGVLFHAVAKGIDGKMYVFGGYNSSLAYMASTQIYDPAADRWTTGAPAPATVGLCQAVALSDNRIIIVGPTGSSNSTLIYDTVGDSWLYGADQPVSSNGRAACLRNGEVVVLGGSLGSARTRVDIYDPVANSWSIGAPLTVGGQYGSAAVGRDGIVYYVGSATGVMTPNTVIERYDRVANVSDVADVSLSPSRAFGGCTADEYGRVFAAGGWDGSTYYPTVQMILTADIETNRVSFVSPGEGAIVSGDVAVGVQFSSTAGSLTVVDLLVDGIIASSQRPTVAVLTLWFTWNASGLVDGSSHVLTARGLFSDGGIIETSITVTVSSMSVEQQVAAIQQQLAMLQAQLNIPGANLTALAMQAAILQAKLDGIIAGSMATNDQMNATFDGLQQQLDDFQTQIDRVENKADNAGMYSIVNLVLVIIVIILVILVMMTLRKKP